MSVTATAGGIQVGSAVFLKGCRHGQPGRVIRIQRNRVTVLWADVDYLAHHQLASLVLAVLPDEGGTECAS
jgi:hypothetical protein